MIFKFYFEDNKLKKEDAEQTIIESSTNTIFEFELDEEWQQYTVYCLIKTKLNLYRLKLHKDEEKYQCKMPKEAFFDSFIKLSLYGVNNEDIITSNELIIPIDKSGYPKPKRHCHHHRFRHHGTSHYHHGFPHHFNPVNHHRNGCRHRCGIHNHFKHPSQWDKFDKLFVYHKMNNGPLFYEFSDEMNWNHNHIDEFDTVIQGLNEKTNYILIDEDKCYAFCGDELIQIVQIPEYITKDKLSFLINDLLEDINLFEDGDIIVSRNFFNRD